MNFLNRLLLLLIQCLFSHFRYTCCRFVLAVKNCVFVTNFLLKLEYLEQNFVEQC